LLVDGVAIPFERDPAEKTIRLRLILDKGNVEIVANNRLRFVRQTASVHALTLFADGGGAVVRQAAVWGLRD
jgi:hypothetical protein